MRLIVLLVSMIAAGVGASELNNKFPEWVINTPKGHSSYCIPMTAEIESARKAAILFAGQAIGDGVERLELTGVERSIVSDIDGHVSSRYEQNIDIITVGEAPSVLLVEEKQVESQLCVLVRAG
ncbi:TPA: hypothetical protein ACGSTL_001423 [Vibrio parahaemolyticus]|uniref:hypothetical protein n=1 Tax=Vibrio campbellii TaxID=680 RepID=UPI001F07EF1E|nr:hypothetical protein [Vibrio campbellii]UMM06867.1 hypothetical protein MKR81_26770 [Vibrio campbellii]